MSNIFIKSISLKKEIYSGDWIVDIVETSKGTFRLDKSANANNNIDQNQISIFMDILKKSILPDIETFLEEELQKESNKG